MSRGRSSKQGVFTQSQFSALINVATACRQKLQVMRLSSITMKKAEALSIFVREEHRDLLISAAQLSTNSDLRYLCTNTVAEYTNPFLQTPMVQRLKIVARMANPGFIVPDYADARRSMKEGERIVVTLPAHLQKYVNGRLALALEFGLLDAMLRWFVSQHLLFPQMTYLFPPIIQLLSQHEATKALAEKYSKPTVPNTVPSPPGLREAFSLVESTLVKILMVYDEKPGSVSDGDVVLDVKFPSGTANFMGWDITLS